MQKLSVDLKNCYGIRSLQHTFNFSKNSSCVIYAPNGIMKTSFAKTFQDISADKKPSDRIFNTRETISSIVDENAIALTKEKIFVMEPYNEGYRSEKISTLLVNKTLKDAYDHIHQTINEKKEVLIKELKTHSGIKNKPDAILAEVFTHDQKEFFTTLILIQTEVIANKEPLLAEVPYLKIFNDKVNEFIKSSDFRQKLADYISIYDQLMSSSTFFRKGVFNHNNAAEIAKNLNDNGFFKAEHSINVMAAGNKKEIKTEKELAEIIQHEKDAILNDPNLLASFEEIDKKIKANKELRDFREYIEQNKTIIPELDNPERFKQKLWIAYLGKSVDAYKALMTEYAQGVEESDKIIAQAKEEATSWRKVIEIFNDRFSVPFKICMENQANVILNNDVPSLKFEFKDEETNKTVPVREQDLLCVLSNGEKRALYILNIIFEVEARKEAKQETLFIVDDIADSFDYKNKYAIIEYLKDAADESFFYQIILTHNFDFYRTVASRLTLPRSHHMHTIKSSRSVRIIEEKYQHNPFTHWKSHLQDNNAMLIASIPFVRNLAEYCGLHEAYNKLTSLLHIKEDTSEITIGTLEEIFKSVLKDKANLNLENKDKLAKALIYSSAEAAFNIEEENIDLENKIVLSIAIRLKAEELLIQEIKDPDFVSKIPNNQTIHLIEKFKAKFPLKITEMKLLEQVNLMTPENIHLNSFMYEPILDMSNDHLKDLYKKICRLQDDSKP